MLVSKKRIVAFIFALVAFTEATLRVLLGLGNPILIQEDPTCGYILKPNQDVRRFFVHTQINCYGMRSPSLLRLKSPRTLRIMFLGDSITYGTTQVDQSEIFTERIRTQLSAQLHQPLEILNASAGAWAISNEYSFIKSRGTFQSDLLVIVINSGDLGQPFSDLSRVGEDLPSRKPLTALGELWSRLVVPFLFGRHPKIDAGTEASPALNPIVFQNLQYLTSIVRLATKESTHTLLVYVPLRRDIIKMSPGFPRARLSEWSRENGVLFVDLTEKELAYGLADITLADRTHFNARGNRIIAQAVTPILLHTLNLLTHARVG